jgi:NAD(P)H-quinone oxidoreductase subunit 5
LRAARRATVSALPHAGIINAGGFVLIRFADVMLLAPGVLAVLVMIGGFTALFGGLVMLTQPAVKTSLAWLLSLRSVS